MFNYEYKPTTDAGRVCLELSLKPFGYDKSPEGIEKVCREYFGKWSALFKYASGCSVLLWTSDGSEILEFTGNLDDSFAVSYTHLKREFPIIRFAAIFSYRLPFSPL